MVFNAYPRLFFSKEYKLFNSVRPLSEPIHGEWGIKHSDAGHSLSSPIGDAFWVLCSGGEGKNRVLGFVSFCHWYGGGGGGGRPARWSLTRQLLSIQRSQQAYGFGLGLLVLSYRLGRTAAGLNVVRQGGYLRISFVPLMTVVVC